MAKYKNTAQAFLGGYNKGLRESNIQGFMASNIMMVLAYYNVIDDHVKTDKTQKNLIVALEAELNRLFNEEFQDIDHIAVAIERVNFVRKHYGMELIEWDRTPPQAASNAKSDKYIEYLEKNRRELV